MSTLSLPRVIQRVAPYPFEDIYGYLIRVCETNHLKSVDFVLAQFIQGRRTIRTCDLEALAYFCRTKPEEAQHLSGVELRQSDGERSWTMGSTHVGKANFIDARHTKICPRCLEETAFVRGEWSLTFYRTCAIHAVRMIDGCPRCRRPLKRTRRRIQVCDCGQSLTTLETEAAPAALRLVSRLLLRHPLDVGDFAALDMRLHVADRLQALSLDGLCKTLWFLGHCLFEFESLASGHGRVRPTQPHAEKIIIQSVGLLSRWPEGLGDHLRRLTNRPITPGSAALIDRTLGPLQYYLYEVIDPAEVVFLTATYEQYIRHIWRDIGATGRTKAFTPQMELPL